MIIILPASGDNLVAIYIYIYIYILGQGRYVEGLIEGWIGAEVGDTVTVNVLNAEIKKLIDPENFEKYKDIVAPGIINDFKVLMAAAVDYMAE